MNNRASRQIKYLEYLFLGWLSLMYAGLIIAERQKDYYSVIRSYKLPNWELLIIVGAALGLLYIAYHSFGAKQIKSFQAKLLTVSIGLLLVELIISDNIYFYTGWDVDTLIYLADRINSGISINSLHYLQCYPNNALLVAIFAGIRRLSASWLADPYTGLRIVSLLSVNVSCLLTGMAARKLLSNDTIALLAYLMAVLLAGLSPWLTVPYSDSLGILFPILTIYIYLSWPEGWGRAMLVSLIGGIGMLIKPTAAIALIAIAIIEVLKSLEKFAAKRMISMLARIAMAVLFIIFLKMLIYRLIGFVPDKESQFGLTHFFMMGLNDKSTGGYSNDDYLLSHYYINVGERRNAEIIEAGSRLRNYGFGGYLAFLFRKGLSFLNDGTFFWSGECTFDGGSYLTFYRQLITKVSPLSDQLREYYYYNYRNYAYFVNNCQAIWLMVLTGCLGLWRKRRDEPALSAMMLALFGLAMFLLLFEQRSRYLFLYLPYFCILAAAGIKELFDAAELKINAHAAQRSAGR